jgi:hypothetical protein
VVLGATSDLALLDMQNGDSAGEWRRGAPAERASADGGAAEAGGGVCFDVVAAGPAYGRFTPERKCADPAVGGVGRIRLSRLCVFDGEPE